METGLTKRNSGKIEVQMDQSVRRSRERSRRGKRMRFGRGRKGQKVEVTRKRTRREMKDWKHDSVASVQDVV
jgi:hypothetical protein